MGLKGRVQGGRSKGGFSIQQNSIDGRGGTGGANLSSKTQLTPNEQRQGTNLPTSQRLTPRANFLYKANAGDTFEILRRNRFGSFYIYWGDGIIEQVPPTSSGYGSESISHTYQKEGEYPVQLFYDSNELEVIEILDDKNFFAHTGDFPTQTALIRTRNTNTYGDIQYFPDTSFSYRIEHEPGVFGDIKGWNDRSAKNFYGRGTAISGSLSDLMNGDVLRLRFDNTDLEGDLNIIATKGNQILFWFNNIKSAFYTQATYQVDVSGCWIRMDDNNLSSSEVDQALIDLSNSGSTGNGFLGRFWIGGSNAPRTAASDAAVNDLQSKNWSVSVNT